MITGRDYYRPSDRGAEKAAAQRLDALRTVLRGPADNEEHEELLEWVGGEFDPEEFDRMQKHCGFGKRQILCSLSRLVAAPGLTAV